MVGKAALLLVMSLRVSIDVSVECSSPYYSDLFIEVAPSRQLRKPANGILCNLVLKLLILT